MGSVAEQGLVTDRLAAGYSGRVLLVVGGASLTSNLGWLVIPPLLPVIVEDLGITVTQAGLALTLLVGLSAVCRYPGGRFADRLSRKTVIVFSFVSWTVGFAILAGASTYPVFLVGMVFVGLGLGGYVPAAYALLSEVFTEKRGQAFGLNNAAFNLGGIAASGMAIVVLAVGVWQLAFVPVVVVMLALLVVFHAWSHERVVVGRVDLAVGMTMARVLFEPRVRVMLVVAAVVAFVWNGGMSFLPVFLHAERGLSPRMASVAFAGVFVTGVFATPLAGAIGDRYGSRRTILGALGFTIVGLGVILVGSSIPVVLVGVVVFAVGLTGFWPVMTAYMMATFPAENRAGDYGVIGTAYMGAGSVGPTFVGVVGEHVHFMAAYAALAGVLVVCLVLLSLRK